MVSYLQTVIPLFGPSKSLTVVYSKLIVEIETPGQASLAHIAVCILWHPSNHLKFNNYATLVTLILRHKFLKTFKSSSCCPDKIFKRSWSWELLYLEIVGIVVHVHGSVFHNNPRLLLYDSVNYRLCSKDKKPSFLVGISGCRLLGVMPYQLFIVRIVLVAIYYPAQWCFLPWC